MADTTLKTRIILRNDNTAGWTAVKDTAVLLKGEVGVELLGTGKAKMKVGDGTSKWSELKYIGGDEAQVFQGEVGKTLEEVVADAAELNAGDIAIVKADIDGTHAEYTAYVYDGAKWVAMDGNYDAENVYFKEDFTVTETIGTIKTLTDGKATLAAAGKNVKEVLASLLAQEANPTATQPAVTCSLTNAKAYEVGTSVTPSYTTTFSGGSYTYGPATGITATAWEVTNSENSESKSTSSGSFSAITVADNTNFTVTAKATYGQGAMPKTNLGNDYADAQIAAGSNSATSSAITGFRAWFVGGDGKSTLTSADIRSLTNKGQVSKTSYEVKASTYAGCSRIVVAIPSGKANVTKVLLKSASNADITSEFKKENSTVNVEGVNGASATAYNVWVYQPASLGSDEVYTITLG